MFPYERVVQWLAGPLSTLIAIGATAVVHAQISHAAALSVATFLLSGAATFLGHHKWLDNLAYWWKHQEDNANTGPQSQVFTTGGNVASGSGTTAGYALSGVSGTPEISEYPPDREHALAPEVEKQEQAS